MGKNWTMKSEWAREWDNKDANRIAVAESSGRMPFEDAELPMLGSKALPVVNGAMDWATLLKRYLWDCKAFGV